jgi:N6-L-threonylcarbamoyladenine synthase
MSDSEISVSDKKKMAKEKRSKFIGLAKAVDRGQYSVTYQPGGEDGLSFLAKSGLPDVSKPFTVLGIESSCDDTGAAVVRSDGTILGEALASQAEIHEKWGGVVPGLAKTAHEENLDRVIELALEDAGMNLSEVDAIGVTVGPGLAICLRVGTNRARELALEFQKPFVGIHHLEAHILMARLERSDLEFPFLALLVSGGHCQLLKCVGIGQYSIIGGTLDDSLGEAFDKTARLLGLPVGGGGGPAVEALAKEGNSTAVPLTIPLLRRKDCDFSYAGLKTNVRRAAERIALERGVESVDELSREDKADIAASFQNIAIKHLEQRLNRAMEMMEKEGIDTIALVGGVAANMELRSRLQAICDKREWSMVVPPPRLCTDQGAMSAWAAVERLRLGSSDDPTNQEVYARYPFSCKTQEVE